MTASRHLSVTGGAHYLAQHLGKPETTVVGSDLYLAPVPSGPTPEHERSALPRPLCRLRRRPRRLPGTQRLRHLRAEQAAGLRPRDSFTLHRTPGHSRQAHFLRRPGHPGILGASTKPDSSTALASPATASSAANTNRCPSRHSPTAASRATAPSSTSTCAGPKANWAGMTPTPAGHIATLESERQALDDERQARIQAEAKLQELQNQLRQLRGE